MQKIFPVQLVTLYSNTVRKYLKVDELYEMMKSSDEYEISEGDESDTGDNVEEQIEILDDLRCKVIQKFLFQTWNMLYIK